MLSLLIVCFQLVAVIVESQQWTLRGGISFDQAGHIYAASSQQILKLDLNGNILATFSTNLPLSFMGVGLDGVGDLYALSNASVLLKFAADGSVAAQWSKFGIPLGASTDPSGNIYVTAFGAKGPAVLKLLANGTMLQQFIIPVSSTYINALYGLAWDASGNFYAPDTSDARVLKLSPNGTVLSVWNTDYTYGTIGIAVDQAGNLYISENRANSVVKRSPNGILLLRLVADPPISAPSGVTLDNAGNLYVTERERLVKFDSDGDFVTNIFPTQTNNPPSASSSSSSSSAMMSSGYDSASTITSSPSSSAPSSPSSTAIMSSGYDSASSITSSTSAMVPIQTSAASSSTSSFAMMSSTSASSNDSPVGVEDGNALSSGAIAAIVICCIIGLVVCSLLFVILYRRALKNSECNHSEIAGIVPLRQSLLDSSPREKHIDSEDSTAKKNCDIEMGNH